MGNLISSTIPNLISGVSQQPWNVRLPTQGEEQINCYSSVTDFLKRRPATRHIANIRSTADAASGFAAHSINRDEQERYIVLASSSGVQVFDLEGREKTVRTQEGASAYLEHALTPDKDLRFLTINDYTFIVNRKATVRTLQETSPSRPPEAIVFIKQASFNTTYNVVLEKRAYSFTTQDGVAPVDQPADRLSSKEIAESLGAQIVAGNPAFDVTCSNSTLWIRRKDGGTFEVKAEDTRSNTHMSVCKGTVQRFSDLPVVAPQGFVTEVVGDSSSSFDNYFCVFAPTDENDDFGPGIWKETVKPGIPYKLDPSTMPHALIRQEDGSFSFGPLEWGERVAGDEKSSPSPSFVDRNINALFFYRNRLAVLSGENVVMSETGEFFNFFLTTVTTLVDSDVIDVAASHTKSNILEQACVFSGGLLLFSEQSQFILEHDTVLANSTVSVKPITEFEASMRAVPASSGKTVFFAVDKGGWGGIREYFTLPDASDQNDAADVTAHVPRYIRGGICKLVCSTNEDILLALSAQKRDSIWVYKYFWNGSEKVQSAWCRWDMAGEVLSVVFSGAMAYLVMRYADGLALESIHFESGYKDAGADFEYCLDRKITEKETTLGAYDPASKTTAVTLPYRVQDVKDIVLVTRPGEAGGGDGSVNPGVLLPVRSVSTPSGAGVTLTVGGDLHGVSFFAGLPYVSTYTFSTFALREAGKGNAVTTGRLQLRSLAVNCANTGYLELHVAQAFRAPSVYIFTGRELGHGSNIIGTIPLYTGVVKCPVLALNTDAVIKAVSSSFLPFALVNASWEGFYNARHQRM